MPKKFFVFIIFISVTFSLGYYFFLTQKNLTLTTASFAQNYGEQNSNSSTDKCTSMQNVTLHVCTYKKKLNWQLQSRHVLFRAKMHIIECYDAVCKFFAKNKQAIATIKLKKAILDRDNTILTAPFEVFGTFRDIAFQGSSFEYSSKKNSIKTDNPARFTHKLFTMTAEQSLFDIKKKKIILSGGVYTLFSNNSASN